jgi:endonuclease-3
MSWGKLSPIARHDGPNSRMKSADIQAFFVALKAAIPNPQTELQYCSVFELLVAVVLSAQATDVSVNKATRRLFVVANTPKKILQLGLQGLEQSIQTIGLYRSKARHLVQTSEIIIDQHAGQVPRTRAALESLPGVGRKTANVILNVAFGQATVAVDTHIFRLANRSTLAPGTTTAAVERSLLDNIPAEYLRDAHHWLVLHGRYTCKARKPMCWKCPVEGLCGYKLKTPAPK